MAQPAEGSLCVIVDGRDDLTTVAPSTAAADYFPGDGAGAPASALVDSAYRAGLHFLVEAIHVELGTAGVVTIKDADGAVQFEMTLTASSAVLPSEANILQGAQLYIRDAFTVRTSVLAVKPAVRFRVLDPSA